MVNGLVLAVRPKTIVIKYGGAGILAIASGKYKKVGANDPIMQQVKMMTDYDSGHQDGEQDSSAEGKVSAQVGQIAQPCKDKVVAGAGFEPATFGL